MIGVIESPDEIDPGRPLAEQLTVKVGVDPNAPQLSADEFEPRARLIVLELHNYILANYPDHFAGTDL